MSVGLDWKRSGLSDAEYTETRARVVAIFHTWIPRLRLQGWRLSYVWVDSFGDEREAESQVAFECSPDWRYLHASFKVYMRTVYEETDEHLTNMIVHELVHVHLSELWSMLQDEAGQKLCGGGHSERVTESLARAFLDTYAAGRDHAGEPAPSESSVPLGFNDVIVEPAQPDPDPPDDGKWMRVPEADEPDERVNGAVPCTTSLASSP